MSGEERIDIAERAIALHRASRQSLDCARSVKPTPSPGLLDDGRRIMSGLPANDPSATYAAPVRRLLSIGETGNYDAADWPDYVNEFAIGSEHVGELIRLACDETLHRADSDTSEVWAPLHAWRVLGQLRAAASVPPLLNLLKTIEEDEAADAELPVVFGMIGPAAIPYCAGFLSDRANPPFSRITAIDAIKEIAARHPWCRAECIGILARTLESPAHRDRWVRGFVVSALIDLEAVEAIDAIRVAFRRKSVDISIAGDEEDVEIELGLRERRATPAPRYMMLPRDWSAPRDADRDQRRIRIPPRHEKVGRNDPCPCGSGRKYKKCCMR